MKDLTTSQRLDTTRFVLDDECPHIEVHQQAARAAGMGPVWERVCPAKVYAVAAGGEIRVDAAGCVECGTCLAVAAPGTLTWHYPRGGFGVSYREG